MTIAPRTLALIAAMTAAALICRYAGFFLMRFVPMTPRIRAGLNAIPLAVLIALILPSALRGGLPETIAIAATATLTLLRLNEMVAILGGMAAIAFARAYGLQ